MKGPPVAPMFIYVSGPYSAPASLDPEERQAKVASNVEIANSFGLKLAEMGHIPFVPHTMMSGWEDAEGLGRERAMNVCHRWVDQCDALFYIASSSGADSERERAVALGIPVYRELKDIPVVNPDLPSVLSADARDALLTEYRECMASYRHTYATIWQAGGIFTAISAAVVALSAKLTLGEAGTGKPDLLALLAPIPFLFWWWGIFRPMNRYGEWRNDRLVEIEDELSRATPGLSMWHFRRYSKLRTGETAWRRVYTFKWLWKPRVSEVVFLFAMATLLAEGFLLYRYFRG